MKHVDKKVAKESDDRYSNSITITNNLSNLRLVNTFKLKMQNLGTRTTFFSEMIFLQGEETLLNNSRGLGLSACLLSVLRCVIKLQTNFYAKPKERLQIWPSKFKLNHYQNTIFQNQMLIYPGDLFKGN